jgi:very-short-patch-repair endonuclease
MSSVERARTLRQTATAAERRLWWRLRARQLGGLKFRRQHGIGPYVVDFACLECGLVVELDGGQHALQSRAETRRTAFLNAEGYSILRLWNHEVFRNLDGVLEAIRLAALEPD